MPKLAPALRRQFRRALLGLGYQATWIHEDYEYASLTAAGLEAKTIDLAAFAKYPPSYRDACIGITHHDEGIARYRGLGAPLIFEIGDRTVSAWKIRADGPPEKFRSDFKLDRLDSVFDTYHDEWGPTAIREARQPSGAQLQLDFIDIWLLPRLSAEFQNRLKFLLEAAVRQVKRAFREANHSEPPSRYLFPFLFRFVMAKVFRDRGDVDGWRSNDPKVLLKLAEEHCHSGLISALPKSFLKESVLSSAWDSISDTLHFQNFSLQDLFFIYESCFIDRETRKELGVHNTPLEIAEYVLAQLPVDLLPTQERTIIEPFCGSGVFLAAALKRIAELYPPERSIEERHSYLQSNLIGIEREPLALEVCRLVLTLVDYPNPNGWRLYAQDVFAWNEAKRLLADSSIIVANPPFEEFTPNQRRAYRTQKTGPPAEFLRRILTQPPAMMGIVLPRSFLTAPDFREANRTIARVYGVVQTVELPDNTFHYARVPTILLLAYDRKKHQTTTVSLYSSVVRKDQLTDFYADWRLSQNFKATKNVPSGNEPFSLWVRAPSVLPESVLSLSKLSDICKIHKGLNWKPRTDLPRSRLPREDVVRDRPANGFALGCEKMDGCLLQFHVGQLRYLSLRDEDQDPSTRANRRDWNKPKAVCNAARSAEPWRLRGYADKQGLAFSKEYFALWPTADISVFAIAALLSSPFANRFSVEHDKGRHNRIETLRELPIPPIELLRSGGEIAKLSERLHAMSAAVSFETQNTTLELCFRLDAAVLDAYNLSASEQRELLDGFAGQIRPTPFEFDRYFPQEFSDAVRLSDFVRVAFDWDILNDRRLALIDKEFDTKLSGRDAEELKQLQRLAFLHTSLMAPLPLRKLAEVHRKAVEAIDEDK